MPTFTKAKFGLGVMGLAAGLTAPAIHAAANGPYVGVFGGFNKLQSEHYQLTGRSNTAPMANGDTLFRIESDDGFMGGFALGYRYRTFRPELEMAYRSNDVDR